MGFRPQPGKTRGFFSFFTSVHEHAEGWRGTWQGYFLAVGLVIVSLLLKLWVHQFVPESPIIMLPLAVLLAAWYAGWGPGLLATAVSTVGTLYLYIDPISSFAISSDEIHKAVVYFAEALLFCWLAAALRERQIRLNRSHQLLETELAERKQTQENLRRSEQRFRELADAMPQLVWTARSDGTVDYYNSRYEQYGGINPSGQDGWEWAPVLHDEDLGPTVAAWQEAVRAGKPYEIAHRVRCVDGTFRWHLSRGVPVRDEKGQIVRWYGTATDIDREKQVELALRENETRFRSIFENAGVGICLGASDGGFVQVNQALCDLLGYKEEELLRLHSTEVGHPEDRDITAVHVKRLMRGEVDRFAIEKRYLRKDGSPIWAHTTVSAIRNESGEFQYFVALIKDISGRKQAEEALRNSEERFEKAFHRSPEPMTISRLDTGQFVDVNESAARLIGIRREDIIGKSSYDVGVWKGDDRLHFKENLSEAGRLDRVEHQFRNRAGELKTILLSAEIIDISGEPHVLGLILDITRRKQIEEELGRREHFARKVIESTLSGLYIHDLQTGQHTYINPEYTALTGYSLADLQTLDRDHFFQLFHEEDQARVLAYVASVKAWEDGEIHEIEYRFRRSDGAWIWCLSRETVFERDERGNVKKYIGSFLDITERKKAEETVQASEALLKRAQEIAHLGSWELDIIENRLTWSDEVYRIFGLEPQQFGATYDAFLNIVHPEDRHAVDQAYLGSLQQGMDFYEIEHRVIKKSTGEVRFVHERCEHVRDENGKILRSVGMVLDITERKRTEELLLKQAEELHAQRDALRELNESLEERVRERTAQVRQLASDLTISEQRERRRIAQVLHDGLQQLLYALRLRLGMIKINSGTASQPQIEELLGRIHRLVEEAITTTRRLTVDLSPPVLEDESLEQALEWLALQMKEVHGLQVELKALSECRLYQRDLRVFLFEIVRELLFNIVKHAGVETARIVLSEEKGDVIIRVEDEGAGFDVEKAMQKQSLEGGFGLFSARERLKLFNGNLEIDSRPGSGTSMTVRMPGRHRRVSAEQNPEVLNPVENEDRTRMD